MDIEKGFCQCGCGQKTKLAAYSLRKYGWIQGEPLRFIHGHASKNQSPEWIEKRAAALRKEAVDAPPKLCECGCGQVAPRATRSYLKRGILKGEYFRFLPDHHLRTEKHKELVLTFNVGKERSPDSKIKDVVRRTGKEPIFSPYIPNRVIRFDEKRKRWFGNGLYETKSGRNQKTHARMVWEYNNGPIPEGFHVHHISGRCDRLEDDRIDNLMLLSAEWNSQHLVSLSKGFGVPEEVVTEIYRECFKKVPVAELYKAVSAQLLKRKEES